MFTETKILLCFKYASNYLFLRYAVAIMKHMNWDNLKYVLMVANKGSISAAARELSVNRSTVLRRIDNFQESLNCRIFERSDSGYVLTAEAEKIINAARELESTLFDIQRQIAGQELKLEGELRVTTTEAFTLAMLTPHFASFREKHPHIVVTVLNSNSLFDLIKRDADIAIRPVSSPEPGLVAHRLQDVRFAAYASPNYLTQHPANELFENRWIGFADSLRSSRLGSWFEDRIHTQNICMRCDSFVTMRVAAEAGIGVALLPCFLGDHSNDLVQVETLDPESSTALWLLAHPDIARSARVNAFIEHFRAALSS